MIKFIDTGEEQNYNLDAKISGRINLLETNSYVLDTEYEMQVASGLAHSAAIDEKGNLYTWGYNNHCQLGNGTNEDQYTPKQIMKGIKFKKIYIGSGALHNMAIDKYGNLYVWGRNGHYQIGDGSSSDVCTPIQMMSGTKFKDMASGASHSLAIDEEGNLYTWGITNVTEWYWGYPFEYDIDFEPRLIMSGTKFKSVAAGDNHSSAIDVNGNLYTWGKNDSKQLGRITDYEDDYTPEKITSSVVFDSVIAGGESNFAFTIEGDLYIWGQRTSSNFGDVPYEDRNVPDLYANGKNYNKVVVGFDHSLIIDKNNDLYAWGSNYWGQLGDGTETDRSTPILIKSGTKFKDISAGNDHSLAVDINNNIYAWGFNDNGQLGDGTTTIRKSPVLINLN